LIDYNTSACTLTEFRISQAYLKLCVLPEGSPQASVLLASIGSHEIRMLADPATDLILRRCFGWNCLITARKRLSTASVATGSKTLCP
jgi:hypothetical protein